MLLYIFGRLCFHDGSTLAEPQPHVMLNDIFKSPFYNPQNMDLEKISPCYTVYPRIFLFLFQHSSRY